MENKISVQDYLANKDLLEFIYVPHDKKVEICDVILNQVLYRDGFATVNSVLLERVKIQIVIESISNLDLSVINDNGLNGYDLLCYNDELESLINNSEFKKFDKIIELRLKDFYNDSASLRGYIDYLVNKAQRKAEQFKEYLSEFIQNLDSQAIANQVSNVISTAMNQSKQDKENKE